MAIVNNILEFELIRIGDYTIRVYSLATIAIIIAITKIVLNLVKKALFRRQKLDKLDIGNAYAHQQGKRIVMALGVNP